MHHFEQTHICIFFSPPILTEKVNVKRGGKIKKHVAKRKTEIEELLSFFKLILKLRNHTNLTLSEYQSSDIAKGNLKGRSYARFLKVDFFF